MSFFGFHPNHPGTFKQGLKKKIRIGETQTLGHWINTPCFIGESSYCGDEGLWSMSGKSPTDNPIHNLLLQTTRTDYSGEPGYVTCAFDGVQRRNILPENASFLLGKISSSCTVGYGSQCWDPDSSYESDSNRLETPATGVRCMTA